MGGRNRCRRPEKRTILPFQISQSPRKLSVHHSIRSRNFAIKSDTRYVKLMLMSNRHPGKCENFVIAMRLAQESR